VITASVACPDGALSRDPPFFYSILEVSPHLHILFDAAWGVVEALRTRLSSYIIVVWSGGIPCRPEAVHPWEFCGVRATPLAYSTVVPHNYVWRWSYGYRTS